MGRTENKTGRTLRQPHGPISCAHSHDRFPWNVHKICAFLLKWNIAKVTENHLISVQRILLFCEQANFTGFIDASYHVGKAHTALMEVLCKFCCRRPGYACPTPEQLWGANVCCFEAMSPTVMASWSRERALCKGYSCSWKQMNKNTTQRRHFMGKDTAPGSLIPLPSSGLSCEPRANEMHQEQ